MEHYEILIFLKCNNIKQIMGPNTIPNMKSIRYIFSEIWLCFVKMQNKNVLKWAHYEILIFLKPYTYIKQIIGSNTKSKMKRIHCKRSEIYVALCKNI